MGQKLSPGKGPQRFHGIGRQISSFVELCFGPVGLAGLDEGIAQAEGHCGVVREHFGQACIISCGALGLAVAAQGGGEASQCPLRTAVEQFGLFISADGGGNVAGTLECVAPLLRAGGVGHRYAVEHTEG